MHKIFQSKGLIQSSMMIIGNSFAYGIAAVALILLTRTLGPTHFGEFSVGFAILLMLNRLNDFGFTAALHKYASQENDYQKINAIFSYTLKVKLIGVISLVVVGVVAYQPLARFLHFTNPEIILAAFLLSGATVLYEQLQAMLQSVHQFAESVVANVLQASTKLLTASLLFFLQTPSSLLGFIGYVAAPLIPVLFTYKFFPSWLKLRLRQPFKSEQRLLRSLATHSAIGVVAIGFIENIDILFVQRYLSTYETGLLGGISRIALLFNLMAYSLATVLNPRVARYQSKQDLGKYLTKAWGVVLLCVLGFLSYLPLARFLVLSTIGSEYLMAVNLLTILMGSAFLSIAVVPFTAVFFSLENVWYFSVAGLIQLAIIIFGNWLFVPIFGLEAAVWSRFTAKAVLLIFTCTLVAVFYKKRFKAYATS